MEHVDHIRQHKHILEARAQIVRLVREFFWSQDFLEAEPPNLIALPGQEPYLSPMSLQVHDETQKTFSAYLHTSPEYVMKKMMAAGFEKIFFLGKCYRDYESFGGHHNPEFTMIEWYRAEKDMWQIMDDLQALFTFVHAQASTQTKAILFERKHMREVWLEHAGVNLDEHLNTFSMHQLCIERGYNAADDESYEDLFYRVFLNEIEPKLKKPTIIHHYPAQMAALAKVSDNDPRYAERFEAYVDGIELANTFTELTDAEEQKRRLLEEQRQRKELGKDVFDVDEEFVDAVKSLPRSAGISLGIDRFVQVLLGCQNIDDVLVLPASKLFNKHV